MKTRSELTQLFTSMRQAFRDFMTIPEVTSDKFLDLFDKGVTAVSEITKEEDPSRVGNIVYDLMVSEAARQRFYNQHNVAWSSVFTC